MEFNEIYKDLKLEELEGKIQNLFPEWNFSFFQLVKEVYNNDTEGIIGALIRKLKNTVIAEWSELKNIFITIVIIILVASIFHTFKDVFQNSQIAELSFYIHYLVLIIIFTNLFGRMLEIGEGTLKNIEEFMKIFFPTFFLLVGNTLGIGTGLAYYQIAGGVIYLVEWCLISFLLPALSAYMLFVLMNGIWEEERLTLLLDFFQKGIKFFLKILLGVLTGASMIQSMIVPILDRVKGETIYKAVESIPGIGEVTEGALRVWLGSAVLIKNSVGIVGCILLILLSWVPLIKIGITAGLFKITAAILSFVGDKKMIGCTNQVGEGIFMILQTVCYGILFFMVLIAITIYTTNGGY